VTFQRPTTVGEPSPAAPSAPALPPEAGSVPELPPTITSLSRAAAGERMLANPSNGPIARLQYIDAVDAWPGGAAPLVRWLRANPDVIGELVGTTLRASDDEVPGLDASLFLADGGQQLLVTVELGGSGEAMLGALLTLMTTTASRAGVWVCGEPRPEHVAAMSWLNRATDARFFMVRVRAARIGSSEPAPILELAMRPPRGGDHGTPPSDGGRRADDHHELSFGEVGR
jgi:hypothetical protein